MTRERKQEFTLRISQANPTELVVILYEMLLCYMEDGSAALEKGEEEELHEAVRKARGCLRELMNSLNLQYEPAPAILSLCGFCMGRLTVSELRRSPEPLQEAEHVIRPLWDAFRQIAKQNDAGPVMNNSQTVYAGLTYGRNTLTENMADQGANRGMLA
ncbi:MAG: flagellar protein FliS [Roseburia sp.]|nr:flagellar protein FliS [Roseburia sp.]MCM1099232.1 flagellar protein FliS [Ruminococcus flavefaciens]